MAETSTVSGTIAGFFENQADGEKAVRALQKAGFSSAHLGVASRGEDVTSTGYESNEGVGRGVANAGHAAGEKAEGMWDKVKSFFGGNEAEPYADERTQGELATREVTPAGAESYGYGTGDLHGTLSGMNVAEERSRYFDHRFASSSNGAVVTVHAGDRGDEAEALLTRFGGDVGENASGYDYSAAPTAATPANDGVQNIQLLGEALRVHKDRVSRGEVRMHKETVTEMQTIEVPVTREELVIERHAVQDGTAVQGSIGDDSVIRIPLSEERAGVDRSTYVREEVSVGKRAVENTQTLSDQVRHEELVVEDDTRTVRDDQRKM